MQIIISNVIYTPLNQDKESGSKKKYDFALEVINNDLFPHCKTLTVDPDEEERIEKVN